MFKERILIIDEPSCQIANLLKTFIRKYDYSVTQITPNNSIIKNPHIFSYSAMLINIKHLDSYENLKNNFEHSYEKLPPSLGYINNLDSRLGVKALNSGMDDFITYPLEIEYLIAKLRALLRRPKFFRPERYTSGDFMILRDRGELAYRTSRVELSRKEYMILCFLIENPNRTITKDQLINRVWFRGEAPSNSSIDTHMSRIRKKLNIEKGGVIQTIHGIGYRYSAKKKLKPLKKIDLENQDPFNFQSSSA